MGDLIDALGLHHKTSSQIRASLSSEERVYDALTVGGFDKYKSQFSGWLLVTQERILLITTKMMGKPAVTPFPWGNVTDFGAARGRFVINTPGGQWIIHPQPAGMWDKGVSEEERTKIADDRATLLSVTATEANEAFHQADRARQGESVGGMMDELRTKRGF